MTHSPSQHAGSNYLETAILSAPPQRLHLMLVQGAIRRCHLTLSAWDESQFDDGDEHLTRVLEILAEMITALKPEHSPALVERVRALYAYMFRQIVSAQASADRMLVEEVIRLLDIERDAWTQLCDQLDSESQPAETVEEDQQRLSDASGSRIMPPPQDIPPQTNGYGSQRASSAPPPIFDDEPYTGGFDSSLLD